MGNYSLAIDIGGTFIKYAFIDQKLNIIKQWKKETKHFNTKDEFYDYLCENIDNHHIAGILPHGDDDHGPESLGRVGQPGRGEKIHVQRLAHSHDGFIEHKLPDKAQRQSAQHVGQKENSAENTRES